MDEDDLAILRAKTAPLYLRLKDRRMWPVIRRLGLDRATHRLLALCARFPEKEKAGPAGPAP